MCPLGHLGQWQLSGGTEYKPIILAGGISLVWVIATTGRGERVEQFQDSSTSSSFSIHKYQWTGTSLFYESLWLILVLLHLIGN